MMIILEVGYYNGNNRLLTVTFSRNADVRSAQDMCPCGAEDSALDF